MNSFGNRYKKSNEFIRRVEAFVPLGSQTFSKSHTQFPEGVSPLFLEEGSGGRVIDIDGNEYVDLICGLLSVILGYRDPDVDEAIAKQLEKGISFSLATKLEGELAERLVEMVPSAEKVRFGKNGSDATSAAIRIARAATGRDRVAVCGYHGWQDWYIGATVRNKGVPKVVADLTSHFIYNDLASLEALFDAAPGEYAAVMMEPMSAIEPEPGFLEGVRDLCTRKGVVLVFDEVVTGFRFDRGGAQARFKVTPDLTALGKGLGNGMPIAAVVGRSDLMDEMEEIFVSSTFGGEALSLAASIAVVEKLNRYPVIETLWSKGKILSDEVEQRILSQGLSDVVHLRGLPPWRILAFRDHEHGSKEAIKTLFMIKMIGAGVLIAASHNVCYAHRDEDWEHVLLAYDAALSAVARELERPGLDERLDVPVIHPVFSVR